jgi:D-alanine-D-alanine ligase
VKPANAGSSVGVQKIINPARLGLAVEEAFKFDTKILIEKAIIAREIELSVLDAPDTADGPRVSIAGEVEPTHEFYSYEAKYLDDNGARLSIPAKITDDQMKEFQKLARQTFKVLGCEGMARVDFFMDRFKNTIYLNEVNTLPGFTSISMYPKMWEASGLPYKELLSQLVDLALGRHKVRRKLVR